jgi:hypothetical protein
VSDAIQAYPLQWPVGWRRATTRKSAAFNKKERIYRDGNPHDVTKSLSVADAAIRVIETLMRMGIERHDIVISTNLKLRADGLPRSDGDPGDPGAAVYWRKAKDARCMAIDVYYRVADNLAAIAASLEAMRAIERHGGAAILDRVFQGFTALPAPESWWQVLGLNGPDAAREQIEQAHRRLAMEHHPDRGGDDDRMARINRARDQGIEAL